MTRKIEDLNSRLDKLTNLKAGWCWTEGLSINCQAIYNSRKLCEILVKNDINTHIYPTPAGNVQLEFDTFPGEVVCTSEAYEVILFIDDSEPTVVGFKDPDDVIDWMKTRADI